MKNKKQNINLIIDIILFTGFILSFFVDLTGFFLHQWLGIIICGLAVIHLVLHDSWVKNVLHRFSDLHTRPQLLFFLDAAIAFGFLGILITGLIVSTWLNLPIMNMSGWLDIHTAFSIETLFFLLVKIGFHWRWISCAIRSLFGKRPADLHPTIPGVARSAISIPLQPAVKQVSRRDFLAIMGVAGLSSYLAVANLLKDSQVVASAQSIKESATATASSTEVVEGEATTVASTSTTDPIATTAPTATAVPTHQISYTCTVRCREGCSYPGRCHRYVDTNGNNLCDNGECL